MITGNSVYIKVTLVQENKKITSIKVSYIAAYKD